MSTMPEFRTTYGWHFTQKEAIKAARGLAKIFDGHGPATIHRYEVERKGPLWRVVKVWRPR